MKKAKNPLTTEFIIAVRGELPEILEPTMNAALLQAPVCIVQDGNETALPEAVARAAGVRVLQPWAQPRGCGQARHAGIMSSTADIVILCDGHMTFPTNLVEHITAHLTANPKHLTCCHMQSLRHDWTPHNEKVYAGAYLALNCMRDRVQRVAIGAKWAHDDIGSGAVPAVMGACYAMRRAWYDTMGQPLRILEEWGCDEELLSLATHIMGGVVWLMPDICGHIYFAQHKGRVRNPQFSNMLLLNHRAVIDVLPTTEPERIELKKWISPMDNFSRSQEDLYGTERDATIRELRSVLSAGPRTWSALVADGIVRHMTPDEKAKDEKVDNRGTDSMRPVRTVPSAPQPPANDPSVCPMCSGGVLGAVQSDRFYVFRVCASCHHRKIIGVK